jgi:hypothetical protein
MNQAGKPDRKLKGMLAEFDAGHYRIEAERDAIRAVNATHLSGHARHLYNADWIVIRNDSHTDFITSDNPVAFDDPGPWRGGEGGLPRYLPLTPRLKRVPRRNPGRQILRANDARKGPLRPRFRSQSGAETQAMTLATDPSDPDTTLTLLIQSR